MSEQKPLVIYDAETDEMRAATQADIDILSAVVQQYGRVIGSLRDSIKEHEISVETLKKRNP